MREWKLKISFSNFYHNDDVSIPKKGQLVHNELLRRVKPFIDKMNQEIYSDELTNIMEGFNNITGIPDDMTETEEFDNYMFELYDFADYHRIWINTN